MTLFEATVFSPVGNNFAEVCARPLIFRGRKKFCVSPCLCITKVTFIIPHATEVRPIEVTGIQLQKLKVGKTVNQFWRFITLYHRVD